MKHTTKTADLILSVSLALANDEAEIQKGHMITRSTDTIERAHAALDAFRLANTAASLARAKWLSLPPARRDLAEATRTICFSHGSTAARRVGHSYSGSTYYRVRINPELSTPAGRTETTKGEHYGGDKSRFRKTNAVHFIELAPEWCPLLAERQDHVLISAFTGLHLIGIHPDGRVAWAQLKAGAQIRVVIGWIAMFGQAIYHSIKSQEDAERGLARQLRAEATTWQDSHPTPEQQARAKRSDRRARLIARLCLTVTATVADARALGYCPSGIKHFQNVHSISDTATLRELMASGDPAAQRLALHIARKVTRQTTQQA